MHHSRALFAPFRLDSASVSSYLDRTRSFETDFGFAVPLRPSPPTSDSALSPRDVFMRTLRQLQQPQDTAEAPPPLQVQVFVRFRPGGLDGVGERGLSLLAHAAQPRPLKHSAVTEKDRSCAIPLHQRLRALKSLNSGSGTAHSIFGSAAPNDPWATALVQEDEFGGAAVRVPSHSSDEHLLVAAPTLAEDAAPSAGAAEACATAPQVCNHTLCRLCRSVHGRAKGVVLVPWSWAPGVRI